MSLCCVDLKKMNKDGDLIIIFTFWHFLRLTYSCSCLLTPLCFFLWTPLCFNCWCAQLCLSQWLLSWKCRRRPGESPSRMAGCKGLYGGCLGVGSQWGLSFYRPQWRQNLLGKAIKPAALCVFECRLVGQCWPFNLTKVKGDDITNMFPGVQVFSVSS